MKKFLRILGVCVMLIALLPLILRGILGVSFVRGDKDFYPPAGRFLNPTERSFNFVVVADTGSQNRTLEHLVMEARERSPEFMLHLGDLVVHRNAEHMYWMMDELDDKLEGIPMYLVPGNHDVKRKRGVDNRAWSRVFGASYYWFGYGNTLFIGLDSSRESIDEEQWAFYEQVMKRIRPSFRYVILFTHVPPQTPEGQEDHILKPESVVQMAKMLRKYPVNAIFCGHVHYYSEQRFHGIPLYTIPTSGQYFVGNVHKFGYLNVSVDRRGIHVENVYSDYKKASEWVDIFFVDMILTNKVRWFSGGILLGGLLLLLMGQKWFPVFKKKKN